MTSSQKILYIERPNHNLSYTVGTNFCLERVDSFLPSITFSLECPLKNEQELNSSSLNPDFSFIVETSSSTPLKVNVSGSILETPIMFGSSNGILSLSDLSISFLNLLEVFYNDSMTIAITCVAFNNFGSDTAITLISVCGM